MTPEVSVVVPALNEEKTISDCIQRIREGCEKADISYEIIIADSSTDKTPDIAQAMGARVIHPEKRGYGNAYLSGFEQVKGNIVVIGDADNTYDFHIIPELIRPIQVGDADFVIGSRLSGKILPNAMPALHQYLGNPLLTILLNFAFGTRYSDCHSGMRAMSVSALNRLSLHTGGMEFASEMLVECARKGLRVVEVPITYYPRISPSNLHSFADGWRHMRFIMLMRPLPFLLIPGLLFIILGLGALFSLVTFRVIVEGVHTLILSALFLIGGTQFLMSGIILKAYASTHGFDACSYWVKQLLNYHTLEKILALGGFFLIIGFISGGYIVLRWIIHSFGVLSEVTSAVLSLTSIIIGLQIIFSSIIISMMRLRMDRGGI